MTCTYASCETCILEGEFGVRQKAVSLVCEDAPCSGKHHCKHFYEGGECCFCDWSLAE